MLGGLAAQVNSPFRRVGLLGDRCLRSRFIWEMASESQPLSMTSGFAGSP